MIGEKLKSLRLERKLSQKEAGEILGISNVVLSRYETNEREPNFETLLKLADLYEVSLDELFGRNLDNY